MGTESRSSDGWLLRLVLWSLTVRPQEGRRRADHASLRVLFVVVLPALLALCPVVWVSVRWLERNDLSSLLYGPDMALLPVANLIAGLALFSAGLLSLYLLYTVLVGIGICSLAFGLRQHLSQEDMNGIFPAWVPIPLLGPILACGLRLIGSRDGHTASFGGTGPKKAEGGGGKEEGGPGSRNE
jgi:hypothetical protein